MRDVWVATGASPTVFRYIDWLITVPLLMIEFYIILKACTAVAGGVFWRLMIGSLVMLVGGYLGEAGYINATSRFRNRNGWLDLYSYMKSLLVKQARLVKKLQNQFVLLLIQCVGL